MTTAPKLCIRCGAPRPAHAYKYCAACRRKKEQEWNRNKRRKKPEKPAPIKSEVVNCRGCIYWRTLNHSRHWLACHYGIDTPYCRNIAPKDCYKHAGTPYQPEGG